MPGRQSRMGPTHVTSRRSSMRIDLTSFETFVSHALVNPFHERYERDAILAAEAVTRLVDDLRAIDTTHFEERGRGAFTTIEGRVKEKDSFFRKILRSCQALASQRGFTHATIEEAYTGVKDLAGVRFSCAYYDEVVSTVDHLVRPTLRASGHGTVLQNDPHLADKNLLDVGNEYGYRSYHFYLLVPTVVDIYGGREPCLCEIQARTELQQVWATKSHDLLYKPGQGWDFSDPHVAEDMRQVSNSLRAADQFLVSIRDRARGERTS
jgi:ppGpp synthetase/RelA/SpoT-type nucleotidyltranferase